MLPTIFYRATKPAGYAVGMSLFRGLQGAWEKGKDASVALVAQRLFATRLEKFGRVLKLTLDSSARALQLEVQLHGEAEPLTVTVEHYELLETEAGLSLVVRRASASRVWVNAVLEEFVRDKPFRLPPDAAEWARRCL